MPTFDLLPRVILEGSTDNELDHVVTLRPITPSENILALICKWMEDLATDIPPKMQYVVWILIGFL